MRDNQSDIGHQGNMGTGRTTKMSLDLESLPHLKKVLTDMYSDKVLAIIREYSTNAWDSHVEAGCPDVPIEITLPRASNPEFVVKDRGVGMSEDEVHGLYTLYGKSTKRNSDDVVGMLGLGCKSALTYTKQFSIIAIKDGMKGTYRIYVGKDGAGEVETESLVKTDEPNGVEIVIPVATDAGAFAHKCREFFSMWEPGTVLIDGQPNESIFDNEDVIELDPDVHLVHARHLTTPGLDKFYWSRKDFVIMGGVPYPIERSSDIGLDSIRPQFLNRNWCVVARIPIGSVNFNPNRETLESTKRTNATLSAVKDFANRRLKALVNDAMDKAMTPAAAMMEKVKWHGVYEGEVIRWQGRKIPSNIYISEKNGLSFYYNTKRTYSPYVTSDPGSVQLNSLKETAFITGHTNLSVPARNREKIDKYLAEAGLGDVINVYLFRDHPRSVWLEDIPVIPWEEIVAVSLPKAVRSSKGSSGPTTYGRWRSGIDKEIRTEEVEKPECSRPVYFSPTESINPYRIKKVLTPSSSEMFVIPKGSFDKFEREFGGIHAEAFVKERIKKFKANLNDEKRYVITAGISFYKSAWVELPVDRIDDPELSKFLGEMFTNGKPLPERWNDLMEAFYNVTHGMEERPKISQPKKGDAKTRITEFSSKYPLVNLIPHKSGTRRRLEIDALVEYINLAYNASQPDIEEEQEEAA